MRLIKFQASWCGPCKALSQTLSTMTLPFPVEEVDIDEDNEAAMMYGIRSVPTMLLMDENDNVIHRITGNQTKQELERVFKLK